MCGFSGFLGGISNVGDVKQVLSQMGDNIAHRGPDDAGIWFDQDAEIGFSHRRLAILDLSVAGHQPMESLSGRFVFIFNGEIYNHLDLRAELEIGEQIRWRGHSDTETLLTGFERWGIEPTIRKVIGMFAFAVWDKQTRTLTLGRDRLGEKPLYYGWQGSSFLFGSEVKAFKTYPSFKGEIDRDALTLLMRHNAIPAPYSVYKGIYKLLPGTLLTVSLVHPSPVLTTYWSARQVMEQGPLHPFEGDAGAAVDTLDALLKDAVGKQMISDVSLGAFLSGGVDSSTVVSLMQQQSTRPVKTFSIGFHERKYDEAVHAKAVAKHLGTDHTELYLSPEDALEVVPGVANIYDEPFADSSQLPTFLVSKMAREHVTVSLSGDAGDELFCGYERYFQADKTWKLLSRIPGGVRQFFSSGITGISPQGWNMLAKPLAAVMPGLKGVNVGDKLHKASNLLHSQSSIDFYRAMISHMQHPSDLILNSTEPSTILTDRQALPATNSFIEQMMSIDTLLYLPDDILTKVDRAAMAVSLEGRVPFLDHRVVEFAWQLPLALKYREGTGKWILKQVLYKYVPKTLIERPKKGFAVPIASWLRGSLRDWAESLLDESLLRDQGFFDAAQIRQKWEEHLSGKRNWQYLLWNVLMFQSWLDMSKNK